MSSSTLNNGAFFLWMDETVYICMHQFYLAHFLMDKCHMEELAFSLLFDFYPPSQQFTIKLEDEAPHICSYGGMRSQRLSYVGHMPSLLLIRHPNLNGV